MPRKIYMSVKCNVCGTVCSDSVYSRKWCGKFYFYCHGCKHHDKEARLTPVKQCEDRKKANIEKKRKKYPKKQLCDKCGTKTLSASYNLCRKCYAIMKQAEQEPRLKKCEGCNGNAPKNFKLCRDCYWRARAAEGALEQAQE